MCLLKVFGKKVAAFLKVSDRVIPCRWCHSWHRVASLAGTRLALVAIIDGYLVVETMLTWFSGKSQMLTREISDANPFFSRIF